MNRAKDISSKTGSKEKVVQSALQVASVSAIAASSKDEVALLAAFREMDDEGRRFIRGMSDDIAEKWPRHQRPNLQLVHGGAK